MIKLKKKMELCVFLITFDMRTSGKYYFTCRSRSYNIASAKPVP